MYLFCDTETSGLKADSKIAQLALRMEDAERRVVAEYSSMILPEGWEMPEETAKFHGITQERLVKYGIAIATAFGIFNRFCRDADVIIFHNQQYDVGRIRHMMEYTGIQVAMPHKIYCTMDGSKDIIKLPPTDKMLAAGRTGYKPPNLQEAHTFFTGAGFDGAHDAMSDVRACSRVYWGIQDHLAKIGAAA